MTQPKRYILHPFKFTVSLITAVLCLVLAFCGFLISRPFSAIFFVGTALLFFLTSLYNGSRITVDSDGIHCSAPGMKSPFIPWDGMKEIGVFGSRLFAADKKHAGTLYIYFSPLAMTDEERFQMILHWPPKDKIVLQYTKERMETVQLLWSSEIQAYNAGDFHF